MEVCAPLLEHGGGGGGGGGGSDSRSSKKKKKKKKKSLKTSIKKISSPVSEGSFSIVK